MNKLSILLLLYLLSVGSANAARVELSDVSFGSSGASNYVLDISNDEINLTTLSKFPETTQFTSETDAVPPTSWIVGLGLGLVFLGYKMKTKPSK
ncbi:MAG: hypothetical protein LUP98_04845 [Methylococcaceae bacterium]|nr:hypothetical protein [Methylococcaceae bacterium]